MNIKHDNTTNAKPTTDRLAKLQRKFEQALAAKAPSVEAAFSEAYELIEIAMKKGLSQKEIIKLVNDTFDLKLHALSFRTLLKNERAARLAGGHPLVCTTCSHAVAPFEAGDAESIATKSRNGIQQQVTA